MENESVISCCGGIDSEKVVKVLEIVNSIVSKPGNIAVRTGHVMRAKSSPVTACICRGSLEGFAGVQTSSMGLFAYIPRALNYLRNYFPHFDHRPIDIALFEIHFFISFFVFRVGRGCCVAHVWEYSPRIIKWLKKSKVKVILDVPIAPAEYAKQRYGSETRFIVFDAHIQRERECFSLADELLAPSAFVFEALTKVGVSSKKIKVIEFGCDTTADDAPAPVPISENGCNYVFAGSLNPRKGLDSLLQVWESWPHADDVLHLCGRLTPFCKDQLSRPHASKILTPGFVDTSAYLRGKHVFVFPSLLEGSAKVVFEALAAGLPCIVTKESGSVVRHGVDGLIIGSEDQEALRRAMLEVRSDTVIAAFGKAAKERARCFTWECYGRRVCESYVA